MQHETFNLTLALNSPANGYKIVTRDGRLVTNFRLRSIEKTKYRYTGKVQALDTETASEIYTWTEKGEFVQGEANSFDLFTVQEII